MSADTPRATAEDGFTTGDDSRGVGDPAFRDAAAEDAGDPAEFAEPAGAAGARRSGPPGPEPDLTFGGRSPSRPPGGHTNGGSGPGGPAGPAGGLSGDSIPPAPALDAGRAAPGPPTVGDPIPDPGPAPAPGGVPGGVPGGPVPGHLRGPDPAAAGPGRPAAARLRMPDLSGLKGLAGRFGRGERGGDRRGERRPSRVRGVRVNQRLWRVEPWSVFKISAIFYLCLFFILLVAGTLLWNVGRSSGTIDQFESFITRMAAYGECTPREEVPDGTDFETDEDCPNGQVVVGGFELDDGTVFKAALFGGVVLVVAGALGNTLMTVLLNLINEVSGGARYTIIKEPSPRSSASAPRAGPTGDPARSGTPGGPAPPAGPPSPAPPDGSTNVASRR